MSKMSNNINSDARILEILEDEKFKEWRFSDFAEHKDYWIGRIQSGHITEKDLTEAVELFDFIHVRENVDSDENQHLWSKIEQNIVQSTNRKNTQRSLLLKSLYIATPIAACFVLALFAWSIFVDRVNINTLQNVVTHTLPDGSTVIINKQSSLQYRKKSFNKQRELSLLGEAFFEVKKGSTFLVKTPVGTIEVLGTSFNVLYRNDKLEVICKTGRVSVVTNDKSTNMVLNPNDKLMITSENALLVQTEYLNELWTSGIFRYESAPLQVVLEELARQYDLKLELNIDISDRKWTGSFDDKDLKKAIKTVCWPMKLDGKVKNDTLFVSNLNNKINFTTE